MFHAGDHAYDVGTEREVVIVSPSKGTPNAWRVIRVDLTERRHPKAKPYPYDAIISERYLRLGAPW